jgi:tRNA(fMet)-specific endonuclease VapC
MAGSFYIIKRRPDSLLSRFEKHAEELCVSAITAAELRFGAERVQRPKLTELVEAFLERLAILDWTNAVTRHYSRLRSALEQAGTPIGNMDLLIVAHAMSEGLTLEFLSSLADTLAAGTVDLPEKLADG